VLKVPYHIHLTTVFKSGSLKLLEPSGSLEACTGIALPLPYSRWHTMSMRDSNQTNHFVHVRLRIHVLGLAFPPLFISLQFIYRYHNRAHNKFNYMVVTAETSKERRPTLSVKLKLESVIRVVW
jgi:hypothetical protein